MSNTTDSSMSALLTVSCLIAEIETIDSFVRCWSDSNDLKAIFINKPQFVCLFVCLSFIGFV